jgi:hypothetical protein
MHLGWIDNLHQWTTDRIVTEPQRIHENILRRQRLDQDARKTTDDLEALASKLASVQKNDVLDPIKRTVLSELVWFYQQQNDRPSALHWAEYWRSYDPWDLDAQIEWASIMMASADTYAEGKATFETLTSRFPELLSLASSYARALAKSGNFGEAFMVFTPFLRKSPDHPFVKSIGELPDLDWDVRLHNITESTQRTSRNWASSKNHWSVYVQAGPAVDKVVFHLPSTSIVFVHSMSLIQKGIRYQVPFSEMEYEGLTDYADGLWKSDYGHATLAIFPAKPGTGDFTVEIDVSIAPPDVLVNLIRPPIGPMTLSQLESLGADEVTQFQFAQALPAIQTVYD